jgi:hypothetical protein
METGLIKLPTMADLLAETETGVDVKLNQLSVLLNQAPPPTWLKEHPSAKRKNEKGDNVPALYLPSEKVEYLLTKIYGGWRVEILREGSIANSCYVVVRLFVINPITKVEEHQDGVGATPMQTDSGKGAMEWNFVKSAAVMMALPSAETYAIKDAAEKFGKIFGKDLNRQQMDYNSLLKTGKVTFDELEELFNECDELLLISPPLMIDCERIMKNKEVNSYNKLYKELEKLKLNSEKK